VDAPDISPDPAIIPHRLLPPRRAWAAHWIWGEDADRVGEHAYRFFSARLQADDPAGVRCLISADTRYRLWINGRWVSDGPPRSPRHAMYYDHHDCSAFLQEGENRVLVLVEYAAPRENPFPGLLCEFRQGPALLCASGDAWRSIRCGYDLNSVKTQMNVTNPFQEHCDAASLIDPQHYDDADWPACFVRDRRLPWTAIRERDIPPLVYDELSPQKVVCEEECLDLAAREHGADLAPGLSQVGRPLRATRIEDAGALCRNEGESLFVGHVPAGQHANDDGAYDPCVTLDFGELLTGHIAFDIEAEAGAVIEIGYAETLIEGRFDISFEGGFALRYRCRGGRQRYRSMNWHGFRYVRLRVRNAAAGVRIFRIHALRMRYPFEDRGSFFSTDTQLEQIEAICRRNLRLCSTDQLMDTPWREAAQWLGDVAAVTCPGIYACFGDTALPGKFYKQSAQLGHPDGILGNLSNCDVPSSSIGAIPDYSLWWIQGLWGHVQYSGEAAWAHTFYPEALRIIRWFIHHLDADELLDKVPCWVFIDWAPVAKEGSSAALNALFIGALETTAALADVFGDAHNAAWMRALAGRMRPRFHGRFWLDEKGCYVDNVIDGVRGSAISEQSNLAAIRWDCAPEACRDRILDYFYGPRADRSWTIAQPFFMVVVLEALRRIGRGDLALRLIRERWGVRFLDNGHQSCLEEWTCAGSWRGGEWSGFLRSHSHAWSACAAEYLIRQLPGIEILEPGCKRVRIAPQQTDFAWESRFPTPLGVVRVLRDASGACRFEAPEEITVDFEGAGEPRQH
jgi:hypothetical protein